MTETDTIAAIATPPGEGGIGVVRMSGPDAVAIAARLVSKPLDKAPTHTVHYGFVRDPATAEPVDEVLVTVMRGPRTYTRQDVVEIGCHGGPVPMCRVLALMLAEGARMARPGEFTMRAFISGRIDLSQAEAALDMIRSRTSDAERIAMGQLRGALSARVSAIRERMLEAAAHIEAYLDFPEDEIDPQSAASLTGTLAAARDEAQRLAATFAAGRLFREGLSIAIVGRPNVGKSSLLNALLMRDRAIVADLPGTTRDTVEDSLEIHGLPVRVVDTAGIRESHNEVEREGVRRSLAALEDADLALVVIDGSVELHEGDREVAARVGAKPALLVFNKSDLPRAAASPQAEMRAVEVSAKTGQGIEALRRAVYEMAAGGRAMPESAESVMVTNLRHKAALDAAGERLDAAIHALASAPREIAALELREALDRLGEITGAVTTDEILERIFSSFCVGK